MAKNEKSKSTSKTKASSARPCLVHYRLTVEQFKLLEATFKANPASYVNSPAGLARKVLCDYMAGRLEYKNPKHVERDVDLIPD